MEQKFLYVYYMNDEKKPITVQINHSFFFDPNDPMKQPKPEYFTLQPCEARVFKIEAPEDTIPYVKKWEKVVLLSYIDLASLESHRSGLKDLV